MIPGSVRRNEVAPPLSAPDARINRKGVAVCGLLLLAVGLVFGQTVRHEFVNMDDGVYASENPHITGGLCASGVAWVFTHSHAGNWHPLTGLSHIVDCQIYGLNAGGHHLTSVLLHAATVVLLFLVLWRMTGRFWPSAIVAAIFAVHPLRAESVAWVSERKDVLSGLCFVLTLGAYVRFVHSPFSWGRYLLLLVIFALGLMAKPMLVTLPALLLLLDYWPLGRFSFRWQLIFEKLPLLALMIIFCAATVWAQGKVSAFGNVLPLSWRIANALVSYATYLVELFWPLGLAAYYPHPEYHLPIWKALVALVLLACISAAALKWRRRYPYFFVGWLWYMGMLVPVIGIVQVGSQAMADRFTYLPQIGLYIALAWGVAEACRSWPYRRWLCGVGSTLVLAVLMGCAWRQTCFWRNCETLWTHTLACTSHNSAAENNLGLVLVSQGRLDEAMEHYREALRLRPDYMEAYTNLGGALSARGQRGEALIQYRKALEVKSGSAIAHNNLGAALIEQGRLDEALRHCQKAVEIDPDYVQAHANLASVLSALGRREEAMAQYRKVQELEPANAEVYTNLANSLGSLGRIKEALAEYRKALELKPDYAEAHTNFGYLLSRLGRFDEAMAHYRKALELKPDTAELQNNVGQALAGRGQLDEAVAHYRKALELKPDYVTAHNDLALVLGAQGRVSEAITHYRKALQIKPDCVEAHANLGNALLGLGQQAEAFEHLRKVAELLPGAAAPRNNLGVVLASQGRFGEALLQFQQALHIQADYAEARKNLAWLRATCPQASLRNGVEAIEHARRADQLCGGKRVDVLDTLAAAYAESGRFPEALTTVRKALELAMRQKSPALADVLRTRIALYEAGKPFHLPPPGAVVPPKR